MFRWNAWWVVLALGVTACGGRSGIQGSPTAASGCPDALLACGEPAVCVDSRWDPRHCGDCETSCELAESCQEGRCVGPCVGDDCACGAPFASCGSGVLGACVDLRSDHDHCGTCDHGCSAQEQCQAGVCTLRCALDELGCTNAAGQTHCVAVAEDRDHCGACGHRCPAGATCEAGACSCDGQACCEAPLLSCGARCVDATSDSAHCGDCDTRCGDHEACVAGACTACSPSHFLTPVAYRAGDFFFDHSEPVVRDLDQDGLLDVVVPDSRASTLSVFFGTGAGNLSPRLELQSAPNPIAVDVADFNQDGNADIASLGSGFLDVHYGGLLPSFQSEQRFAIDDDWNVAQPLALALADVQGDSAPEAIVVTRTTPGTVPPYQLHVWVVGMGERWLSSAALVYEDDAEGRAPREIQVVDLNGDHLLDIALLSSTVNALLNNGDGTFQFVADWSGGVGTQLVPQRILDLNGDQRLDVLSADPIGSLEHGFYLRVALGNEQGGFDLQPRPQNPVSSTWPNLSYGDVDGDGNTDVVSRESDDNFVSASLGDGAGHFVPRVWSRVAGGRAGMTLADLDRDGKPDLIATHDGTSSLTVHRGRGNGTFESYLLAPPDVALRSAVVLPRTGKSPLVLGVGGQKDGYFLVLESDGKGGLSELRRVSVTEPLALALADVDGDGTRDVVVSCEHGVYWLRAEDGERFAEPALVTPTRSPYPVQSGDFDGDKQDELVFPTGSPSFAIEKRNAQDGTFSETLYSLSYTPRLSVGDLDGDQLADLVVSAAFESPARLQVWLGSRTELPQPSANASVPVGVRELAVVDLDRDGQNDLFVGHYEGYAVFQHRGPGELQTLASEGEPIVNENTLFADIDGDGAPDLLAGLAPGNIQLWRGKGAGRFAASEGYLVPGVQRPLALGDFDRDGIDDLLLTGGSQYSLSLSFLRGALRCE